jgi:two-component system NarL family response regulator
MGDEQRPVRVILADGHALFREAVTSALEGHDQIAVVADVGDGPGAIEKAVQLRPDCAFLDVHLPGIDGIEATRRLKDRLPGCAVIVLSPSEDDALLVAAVEAGASGFLTKDCPLTDLIAAARSVLRGEVVVPPRLLAPLLSGLMRHRKEQDEAMRRLARLTRREREVLALLANGAGNDRIAESLVISPQTARTHVQNLITKLGVHSRLEAAMFAAHNVLDLDTEPLASVGG